MRPYGSSNAGRTQMPGDHRRSGSAFAELCEFVCVEIEQPVVASCIDTPNTCCIGVDQDLLIIGREGVVVYHKGLSLIFWCKLFS